jgi:hypothetical protein
MSYVRRLRALLAATAALLASAVATPARRGAGAAACGAVVVVALGGLLGWASLFPMPDGQVAIKVTPTPIGSSASAPVSAPSPVSTQAPGQAQEVASFHQIIMPDLVVIDPAGLDARQLARLGRIRGLRNLLAVDGASITVGGQHANVIGVNPSQYRPWTPLATASNQQLWDSLASGNFLAAPAVRHQFGLQRGTSYPLTGTGTVPMDFGGPAQGIAGIDVVVNSSVSAQLGLIHNVAALVNAPGVAITRLRHEVRLAVGHTPSIVLLRSPALPVGSATSGGGRPATYIQLFQASAAQFCPGLSWTVLAAIGQIESADGTNDGPSSAGALGPMQFMPATWKTWGITAFGEPAPPNIMDPYDAVPSAARYLCASGGSTAAGLPGAIFAYNHAHWYVSEVLGLAQEYAHADG